MQISSSMQASQSWALHNMRTASASGTGQAGGSSSVSSDFAAVARQGGHSGHGGPPAGPPPDAVSGGAMAGLSTMQFAAMGAAGAGGDGPPQDPIASLDSDGDGSVSGSEFGLDSASDAAKKLFSAIDTSGDGALSSDEISAMRDKMMAAHEAGRASGTQGTDGAQGTQGTQGHHGHHGGPPPGGDADGDGDGSSSSTTSSKASASSGAQAFDAKAMIEKIAQAYASYAASQVSSTSSLTATA